MIGNDLVYLPDFTHSLKRTNRRRSKILTEGEREALNASRFPFVDALYWSIKESAYKALMRERSGLTPFFAPKKIEVVEIGQSQSGFRGKVRALDLELQFESRLSTHYIHTLSYVASVQREAIFTSLQFHLPPQRQLTSKLGNGLSLHKDERKLPFARETPGKNPLLLSISHDGPLIAYALYPQPVGQFVI